MFKEDIMKKKLLLAVLGATIVLAGCGSNQAPAQEVSTDQSAQQESAKTEENEQSTAEPAAEGESTDAGTEGMIEEESLGEEVTPDENGVVSNGFMTITMPEKFAGTYLVYARDGEINVYDKESNEKGFGGFVFGICVTDDYSQYGGMRKKIGELTDKDGQLYHVLLSVPSDVQWDYTAEGGDMPAAYKALSDADREIAATLQPVEGGEYVDGAGTKGEEIYGELAKEIAENIKNAKDATELEEKQLSSVYFAMTQGDTPKDPMTAFGVSYGDYNIDGVDEMVVADMESGEVYDIFASVNGKPAHVASGYFRDYYKVCGYAFAEYVSEGAGVSVINVYDLLPNSTEMLSQYSVKLDETEGAEQKYAVSYDEGKTWEDLTEEDYKQRVSNIEYVGDWEGLKFTALGDVK